MLIIAFIFGLIVGHCLTVFLFVVAKSHMGPILSYVNTATQVAHKAAPQKRGFIIDGDADIEEERREEILSKNAKRGSITYLKDFI